jgi:hypothetical protein
MRKFDFCDRQQDLNRRAAYKKLQPSLKQFTITFQTGIDKPHAAAR